MTALDLARKRIESALAELEPLFTAHKLTLVARCTDESLDADIVVTNDDHLFAAASVVTDLAYREAPHVCPGCHAVGGPCLPGCIDAERDEREGWDDGPDDDLEADAAEGDW